MTGLSNGSYKVSFFVGVLRSRRKRHVNTRLNAHLKYITQYYNNQTLGGERQCRGGQRRRHVTSGINAAMVPAAPLNTAAPVVSGTPTVGDALTCSNGSWTGEATLTLSVGVAADDAVHLPVAARRRRRSPAPRQRAYVVQSTDEGHGLGVRSHREQRRRPLKPPRATRSKVPLPAVNGVESPQVVVSGGSARVRSAARTRPARERSN